MSDPTYTIESTAERLAPLALSVDPAAARTVLPRTEVLWSAPARDLLERVRKRTGEARKIPKISLPYTSLRQLLELHLPGASRIRGDLGMRSLHWRQPPPFAYVDCSATPQMAVRRSVEEAIGLWVTDALAPWASASTTEVAALRGLLTRGEGVELRTSDAQVVPWDLGRTGVASPPVPGSYRALTDWATWLLAGKELLPGTGAWGRLVSSANDGGGVLLSPPLDAWEGGPAFAFSLKVEVATVPFQPQPLLLLKLGKRRFLPSLPEGWTRQRRISGHIWSATHEDRVFTFDVRRSKGSWEVDTMLEAYAEALHLNAHAWSPQEIAKGRASTSDALVYLVHSNALQGAPAPAVPSGVPERDKLDLLERVTVLLAPHGCAAMPAPTEVEGARVGSKRRGFKQRAETLLWSIAESARSFPTTEDMSAAEVRRVLRDVVRVDLRELEGVDEDPTGWTVRLPDLEALAAENAEALRRHRPNGVSLVLLADPVVPKRVQRLASGCLQALVGDGASVSIVPLPAGVSGPRKSLAGAGENPKARFQHRVDAWRETAEGLAAVSPRVACIVLSPQWFDDRQHDDSVNKASGKHALAVLAGASVQYLLPPKRGREAGTIDLKDFLFRLQAALGDVAFAHAGRVDDLKQLVSAAFPERPPKTVVGFTTVRRNAGRQFRSTKGASFVAAIRVDVDSGQTSLQFGTADASGALRFSGWSAFFEGITEVARAPQLTLGRRQPDQSRNYQAFIERTMEEILEQDSNAVVFIDSSSSAGLWRWLSDQQLDPHNVKLGAREHMQDEWSGVRLVRVREGWAPGLPTDKVKSLAGTDGGASAVRAPTAKGGLYRLPGSTGGARVYLSAAGTPVTFKEKKGVSCYRSTLLLEPVLNGERKRVKDERGRSLHRIQARDPASKRRWMLPDPLEFTAVLTPSGEDPDATARFAHSLRSAAGHFSEQTKLPVPLFFARVLREYVAAFGIEEAEEGDEAEES